MAKNYLVARPYAKALFLSAKAEKTFTVWNKILKTLVSLIQQSLVLNFLLDPRTGQKEKAQLLVDLCQSLEADSLMQIKEKVESFLNLLLQEKRITHLAEILELYQEMVMQAESYSEAEVFSAYPLEEEDVKKLQMHLSKYFNKKIFLKPKLDPNLIGGALIKMDHWVWNGSVRDALNNMRKSLNY